MEWIEFQATSHICSWERMKAEHWYMFAVKMQPFLHVNIVVCLTQPCGARTEQIKNNILKLYPLLRDNSNNIQKCDTFNLLIFRICNFIFVNNK